ncbi:MAG TPA: GDSL-type esterase/lipase family protein, partial [Candidatus Dormibacteraeota bacterium]|nr:GDSL-type esterase/lipase family protein [Candidatus Dormibacteraeota bacterium]
MLPKSGSLRRGAAAAGGLAAALLAAAVGGGVIASPAAPEGHGGWVGTWATGDQPLDHAPLPAGFTAISFSNATLREIVHVSVGGSALRVRLDDTYGDGPLTFADAHVGLAGANTSPAIAAGTDRTLTFGGQPAVTVAQGAQAFSDPVRLHVPAQADLAVSLFLPGSNAMVTGHHNAKQGSFVAAAGDHAADVVGTSFTTSIFDWYWLNGVDVFSASARGAVVAIGDSITNGAVSTFDGNNRWTDFLARRLLAAPASERRGVLDEGIDGAQLLTFRTDCCPTQEAGLAVLDRSVIAQTGVTHVIVLLGTNDLGFGVPASEAQVVGAQQQRPGLRRPGVRDHRRPAAA